MQETIESALQARAMAMADACTRCGKCVEVCPITDPAGVTEGPRETIDGIIDILRQGKGNEAARKWANGCVRSGECITACDYGVNPRFLLGMARAAMARSANDPAELRRSGVESFRQLARDVNNVSRMLLDDTSLQRLGQGATLAARDAPPDVVFYTGCNVLKTPHIALVAVDILDALGISYEVMGGPTHCCGIRQLSAGDVAMFGRVAENTLDKLAQSGSAQVLSWCPSCHVQFTEMTLPSVEITRGTRPFEMIPFTLFVRDKLDRLRPLLRQPVPMRIALYKHPGIRGVVEAAEDVLRAVPGVELVDLDLPSVGLQGNDLKALPIYRRELQRAALTAAEATRVDALVAVYHSEHRELCAHERDWPFRILNIYEIVGFSLGIHHDDQYKRLKIMQDADAIMADCQDLITAHGLDPAAARTAIQAMLAEQPLPLRGA